MQADKPFLTLQLNSQYFLIITELVTCSLNNITGTIYQILGPLFAGLILLILILMVLRLTSQNFNQ
jgi:hypothetical protein